MKGLKLGMPILATTSLMLDNEILKLHPTTLVDAYETSHHKELQIKLGKGHWGCLPTRDRSQVFISPAEVKKYAKSRLAERIEEAKGHKPKEKLYYVRLNNNHSLTISIYSYSRSVNSLAEGSYAEYVGRYASVRIENDRLPSNCFHTIEEAIECFVKKSKIVLC